MTEKKGPSNGQLLKSLKHLSDTNILFIEYLDRLMRQPSTIERGRMVAKLLNRMELVNDHLRLNNFGSKAITQKTKDRIIKNHSVKMPLEEGK